MYPHESVACPITRAQKAETPEADWVKRSGLRCRRLKFSQLGNKVIADLQHTKRVGVSVHPIAFSNPSHGRPLQTPKRVRRILSSIYWHLKQFLLTDMVFQ
jgi:hypothetical protein